jgi:hypothetical protein
MNFSILWRFCSQARSRLSLRDEVQGVTTSGNRADLGAAYRKTFEEFTEEEGLSRISVGADPNYRARQM